MPITKQPDGRWRARYRDARGRDHNKRFDRRVDAARWLDDATARIVTGTWVDPARSRITVGAWADQWLAGRVHLKPKTLVGYVSLLETRIRPTWGDVPLSQVSNADVAAWVAAMRRDGLSASRTRQATHLLGSVLESAVRDRRLASNPARGLELPRLPKTERRYLTHSELADLAAECGELEVLVLVLGYTGVRWGEAAALHVRNVDTMRRRVEVVEAVTEVNGRPVFGTPKTHQARSVPVPAFLNDRLVTHVAGRARDELVFTAPRGGVLRLPNFRRRVWNDACIAVGLGDLVGAKGAERYAGLVPHELRHTAASLAIASGANVKAVQSMLGHASATLTLDRYGHLFPDELDAVAERVDAARTADLARSIRGRSGVARLADQRKQA